MNWCIMSLIRLLVYFHTFRLTHLGLSRLNSGFFLNINNDVVLLIPILGHNVALPYQHRLTRLVQPNFIKVAATSAVSAELIWSPTTTQGSKNFPIYLVRVQCLRMADKPELQKTKQWRLHSVTSQPRVKCFSCLSQRDTHTLTHAHTHTAQLECQSVRGACE